MSQTQPFACIEAGFLGLGVSELSVGKGKSLAAQVLLRAFCCVQYETPRLLSNCMCSHFFPPARHLVETLWGSAPQFAKIEGFVVGSVAADSWGGRDSKDLPLPRWKLPPKAQINSKDKHLIIDEAPV